MNVKQKRNAQQKFTEKFQQIVIFFFICILNYHHEIFMKTIRCSCSDEDDIIFHTFIYFFLYFYICIFDKIIMNIHAIV